MIILSMRRKQLLIWGYIYLKLSLVSLNHEQNSVFLHYAVCLSLRSTLFCSVVGGALQHDHNEHAQKATANMVYTPLNLFVQEMFVWSLHFCINFAACRQNHRKLEE